MATDIPTNKVHPTTTLRLLQACGLVMLPHLDHLPLWASMSVLGFGLWRAIAAKRHWPMPARWARILIMVLAMVGVYAQYGRISGQHPGTTLLILLLAVKLTELKTPRDHAVLALFGYVVLATQFLFSQELPQVLWLIAGSLAITLALLDLSRPAGPLPWRVSLRHTAAMMLQGIPLMLILFVLFPRISGPLWGMPQDAGRATIGLSDSMKPGSISGLTDTGAVAFRARFEGQAPDPKDMYWRGPVFWSFDGSSWSRELSQYLPKPEFEALGKAVTYQVTLEPHGKRWLFALDMPVTLPEKSHFTGARQLLSYKRQRERSIYKVSSALSYQLEAELSAPAKKWGLQLPEGSNRRAQALAKEWQSQGLTPQQISEQALGLFREEAFIYTLRPPLLGRDGIDEFLFGTRRGFCEHFAGAYTFLMRAAGVPARIVTGYQGAEYNAVGGYYIIRQADAHAWVEIWQEDQGWVRVDPTAAVAPERIEQGMAASFSGDDTLPLILSGRFPLMYRLQLRWDWVNQSWYEWVLAYGPELQKSFLGNLGLADWGRMILALTLLSTLFLTILGAAFIWQSNRRPVIDDIQKEWLRFCKRLERAGIQRHTHEGPVDFVQRACQQLPRQASDMQAISQHYLSLRYGHALPKGEIKMQLAEMRQKINRFKAASPTAA